MKFKKLLTLASAFSLFAASAVVSEAKWESDATGWWYSNASSVGYATGWQQIDGQWYLFGQDGYMKTGWQNDGYYWYYLNDSGVLSHDQWVDNYYVLSSGVMAVNQWIGNYYVGTDGVWIPNYGSPSVSRSDLTHYLTNPDSELYHVIYDAAPDPDAYEYKNTKSTITYMTYYYVDRYIPGSVEAFYENVAINNADKYNTCKSFIDNYYSELSPFVSQAEIYDDGTYYAMAMFFDDYMVMISPVDDPEYGLTGMMAVLMPTAEFDNLN